jgi:hypothetical protein
VSGLRILRSLFAGASLIAVLWATPGAALGQRLDPARSFSWDLNSSLLWIDGGVAGIYDSNVDHDETDLESLGARGGFRFRLKTSARKPLLRFEYEMDLRWFDATDRWNRQTHHLESVLKKELGPVGLEASGGAYFRVATEDRELGNVYVVQPRISVEGGPLELRLDGRYWTKRFDEAAVRDEWIRGGGGDVGWAFGSAVTWRVGYRYEESDSEKPSRRYERRIYSTELEAKLGRRTRATLEVRRSERFFPERTVQIGEEELPTRDTRWIPEAELRHRFPRGEEVVLEYRYQVRDSNDLDRVFDGHRVSLGFRFPFFGPWARPTERAGAVDP